MENSAVMPDVGDRFLEHRPFLYALAYRMLGSAADAEDLVQDCFLRAQQADLTELRSPRAYLSTVLTRLCINHLESARVRREKYVGTWLPEPVSSDNAADLAELGESLKMAFLVLLEELNPDERAVFLLSDVFDYSGAEVAAMVGKSKANCRQILHRARLAIRVSGRVAEPAKVALQSGVLQRFTDAIQAGDLQSLTAVLDANIVIHSDGGGRANAALRPVRGADKCARFFLGVQKKGAKGLTYSAATINREPGLVAYRDGAVHSAWVFQIAGNQITAVYGVLNPDKLGTIEKETHGGGIRRP